jgi:hypothetical protein
MDSLSYVVSKTFGHFFARTKATGFDPGKDLDSQPNLDRTLGITKIAKRILDQSLLELPRPTASG